jgi:hypothetical protein
VRVAIFPGARNFFVSPESEPWGRDNRCDDEPEVIGVPETSRFIVVRSIYKKGFVR